MLLSVFYVALQRIPPLVLLLFRSVESKELEIRHPAPRAGGHVAPYQPTGISDSRPDCSWRRGHETTVSFTSPLHGCCWIAARRVIS